MSSLIVIRAKLPVRLINMDIQAKIQKTKRRTFKLPPPFQTLVSCTGSYNVYIIVPIQKILENYGSINVILS